MGRRRAAILSRREREMMDIIYESGSASVAEVRQAMTDPPSYSAVRATLGVLVDKGHLKHTADGPRYVYSPTVPPEKAGRSALEHLMETFFNGSTHGVVAALLDMHASKLTDEEFTRLSEMIEEARREGR